MLLVQDIMDCIACIFIIDYIVCIVVVDYIVGGSPRSRPRRPPRLLYYLHFCFLFFNFYDSCVSRAPLTAKQTPPTAAGTMMA